MNAASCPWSMCAAASRFNSWIGRERSMMYACPAAFSRYGHRQRLQQRSDRGEPALLVVPRRSGIGQEVPEERADSEDPGHRAHPRVAANLASDKVAVVAP